MRKRHIAASAITLTIAAAGLSINPIAASAYTIPHSRTAPSSYNTPPFKITNENSGKCLDVYNWSTQAGANIDQ